MEKRSDSRSDSVNGAALRFLASLNDYQIATRDMNRCLQKLNSHLIDFAGPLKTVVTRSSVAIAPAHPAR